MELQKDHGEFFTLRKVRKICDIGHNGVYKDENGITKRHRDGEESSQRDPSVREDFDNGQKLV